MRPYDQLDDETKKRYEELYGDVKGGGKAFYKAYVNSKRGQGKYANTYDEFDQEKTAAYNNFYDNDSSVTQLKDYSDPNRENTYQVKDYFTNSETKERLDEGRKELKEKYYQADSYQKYLANAMRKAGEKEIPKQKHPKPQSLPKVNNNTTGGDGTTIGPKTISPTASIDSKQDNDQSLEIKGDNNTVDQTQDNSINLKQKTTDNSINMGDYYGGSSRTFNYSPSKSRGRNPASMYDDPVSKATMGGFYDPDTSPASSAKFLKFYTDQNLKAQSDNDKKYAMDAEREGYNDFSRSKADYFDVNKSDDRIAQLIEEATKQRQMFFKDMFG